MYDIYDQDNFWKKFTVCHNIVIPTSDLYKIDTQLCLKKNTQKEAYNRNY